jgi:ankyrin repeat protein
MCKNAQVNIAHTGDVTPLMAACTSQHTDIAELLLSIGGSKKCKLEVEDARGRSALVLASAVGCLPIVKMLCDKGADVKSTDLQGNTALITACGK